MEAILHRLCAGAMASAAFLAVTASNQAAAQVALPEINVTDTRLSGTANVDGVVPFGAGIVGASTSVITAEDIARSPAQTLPDILSREPGVQVTNPFGAVNGARSVVDMRGFGASAGSNTLILINGRRVNDVDIASFDLASIPRESIERIEITRGNSGAVLYGDGAMGGVINIVTKTGVALPPRLRLDGAFGSFNYKEGNLSANGSNGPWSASVFSNAIGSDGYRQNNHYTQYNGVLDLRYTVQEGSFYLNLSADDQSLGLPGGRRVQPDIGMNQLITNPRGATTPYDFGDKQGYNGTIGFTRMLAPGAELIVDGGIRQRLQQAAFFNATPTTATTDPLRAVDTTLTTSSFTPRIKLDSVFGGMRWNALGGIDYYNADYNSDRSLQLGSAPINTYDLNQSSLAAYWMQTVSVLPTTDISGGGRIQRTSIEARDKFDANAPGGTSCFPFGCFANGAQGIPLDESQTNHAFHLGIEHRFTPGFALFGRWAQSFRVPNVDERVGMVTSGGEPTTFRLRTQKSHDIEGGVRFTNGPLKVQWSIYDMHLTDEIHFRYAPNFIADNTNLDPTRRYGNETIVTYAFNEAVRFKGGLAYTRSVFREGRFAGNEVPLVSKWTGSGGVSWDIWQKYLTLDTVVRYVGDRRMDNDQRNLQPLIPAATTLDMKLGGQYEQFFWSVAVVNLFNKQYFDYAIASPFPDGPGSSLGTYNAYPLPGRTVMVKAGMTW